MVSIEDKLNYLTRISDNPKLSAFNQLLVGKSTLQPNRIDLSETDEIYYGMISAIQTNDKGAFEKYYSKKSKSNPSKESPAPFVNDDFLIFSLIVGVFKFNLDKSWISSIVSIRSTNPITTTLNNILAENYYSTSNLPEIVMMFLHQVNQRLITNDLLNITFKKINDNIALLDNKSDFQILCAIHSYNSIILLKEAPEGSEVQQLKTFNSRFKQRVKVLSWFVQTAILIAFIYVSFEIVSRYPSVKKVSDQIGSVLKVFGIIGLSQLGSLFPIIKRTTYNFMLQLFGYPKILIEKINKKEE